MRRKEEGKKGILKLAGDGGMHVESPGRMGTMTKMLLFMRSSNARGRRK